MPPSAQTSPRRSVVVAVVMVASAPSATGADLGVEIEVVDVDVHVDLDRGARLRARDPLATTLRAEHVALVGAFLDLPRHAVPVGRHRDPALPEGLKAEARRGVARLVAPQLLERALDRLALLRGRQPLEALKVLVVQGLELIEAHLELLHQPIELDRVHRLSRLRPDHAHPSASLRVPHP